MSKELKNRIKSLLWRAGGVAFIAMGAYVTGLGDIFLIDPKILINLGVIAFLGLVMGEVTKYLNK